jgi:PKHD-type hydroxylase
MFVLPSREVSHDIFRYYEKVFTPEECQKIIELGKEFNDATVNSGENGKINKHIRDSRTCWLNWSQETDWIFQKLSQVVLDANNHFWNFQLTGFLEPLQLTHYSVDQFYNWHTDNGGGNFSKRKLSLVVQLTDPSAYEGGELELMPPKTTVNKEQGTVIVFPSYVTHRVLPVLSGERHSLVAWVSGDPYR